jgi:hypothetical protein
MRLAPFLALVVTLLAGCAGGRLDVPVALPPAPYDHPFPGVNVVHAGETLDRLQLDCAKSIDLKPGDFAWACSTHIPRVPLICEQWYPSLAEVSPDMLARLMRVEVANCNGWHDP